LTRKRSTALNVLQLRSIQTGRVTCGRPGGKGQDLCLRFLGSRIGSRRQNDLSPSIRGFAIKAPIDHGCDQRRAEALTPSRFRKRSAQWPARAGADARPLLDLGSVQLGRGLASRPRADRSTCRTTASRGTRDYAIGHDEAGHEVDHQGNPRRTRCATGCGWSPTGRPPTRRTPRRW
jgi:hypothetical protein